MQPHARIPAGSYWHDGRRAPVGHSRAVVDPEVAEDRLVETRIGELARQCFVLDERSRNARQSGCRLDAVAALRREPEETFYLIVPADDRRAVGHEAAQPRPFVGHALHLERGRALDPLEPDSHVDLFGLGIGRRTAGGVRGRDEQATGVGLEVELLADVIDERPAQDLSVGRPIN